MRFGVPLWAAKKGDSCLHQGKVTSGSPDTFIEKKKAARLTDTHVCVTHVPPVPPPGLGPGVIVTSSKTVIINNLGAARKTDLCKCKTIGMPPPGAANPQTASYAVTDQDRYEKKLVPVEHELADWDKVKDLVEPEKGVSLEPVDPLGAAEAKPPPKVKTASSGAFVAQGPPGANKAAAGASPPQGTTVDSKTTAQASSGDAPKLPEQTPRSKEDKRKRPALSLALPPTMDLSVGSRSGKGGRKFTTDAIAPISCSVWIGP